MNEKNKNMFRFCVESDLMSGVEYKKINWIQLDQFQIE